MAERDPPDAPDHASLGGHRRSQAGRHQLAISAQQLDGPAILALVPVVHRQVEVRARLGRPILEAEGERPGALADLPCLRVLGDLPRALAEQRQGSGEPGLITERLGAVPGFLHVPSNRGELAQRHQGVAESDPDVDGRFPLGAFGRQMPERFQGLLVAGSLLAVRPPRASAGRRLGEVGNRPVPDLRAGGVVGELLDVLDETVGVEPLDRLRDPRVERAAPLAEHAPVGDLVGEGVLERVLDLGEERCLVEELGGL